MKTYELWTHCENDERENRLLRQFSTRAKALKALTFEREVNINPNRTYTMYVREIE